MNIKKLTILLFILIPVLTSAHGKKKKSVIHHEKDIKKQVETSEKKVNKTVNISSSQNPDSIGDWLSIKLPTKHPIVVHFPIVLLLLSFPFYFICIFYRKEDFRWLAVIVSGGGFLGGLAATYIYHPHTAGLPAAALKAIEHHEFFAGATLIISGIATLSGAATLFKAYRKKILEYITLGLLILSIISVSITGHFGGTLAYVYGVGIQGKYLETDSH